MSGRTTVPSGGRDNWGMELLSILHAQGVVSLPSAGPLSRQARRAVANGLVVRPLPGVVMDAALVDNPDAWIRAARCWRPDAVLTGRAALRAQCLPRISLDGVDLLVPHTLSDRPRVRGHRETLPDELVITVRGGSTATAAAACLFLGERGDWDAVCLALRKRKVAPDQIEAARAMLPRRRDAQALDRVVRLTRGNPWSVAEIEMQELWRLTRVTGWRGNLETVVRSEDERHWISEKTYYLDGAFQEEMLDVEMNGREFHDTSESFESDAAKIRALTAIGWTVMPVTPTQMRQDPRGFLEDVVSRLHRRHRPVSLPRNITYRPDLPGIWELG